MYGAVTGYPYPYISKHIYAVIFDNSYIATYCLLKDSSGPTSGYTPCFCAVHTQADVVDATAAIDRRVQRRPKAQ